MEYKRYHRCQGTNMPYKCKIFGAFNTALALVFCIYSQVCTISKHIRINEEKEICLAKKRNP